jgi:hypothetical protein
MGPTEAVVHKGVVEAPPKAPIALANPEPAHIVFVARPFTFVEKLLYPLMKE